MELLKICATKLVRQSFCVAIFAMAFVSASYAASPVLIGTYGAWSAYTYTEQGNKICYMVSKPISDVGNYTSRGDIFAIITHRPSENAYNVFSYIAGYPYKKESVVNLSNDSDQFQLLTLDETAWTSDNETDERLAEAIKAGSRMTVKGTSARGTLTTDTYSLKGSSKAHEAIGMACGI